MIDEGSIGTCFGNPTCGGALNCSLKFAATGSCDSGCEVVPGRCNASGNLLNYCNSDADCTAGTCQGVGCGGFVACSRFEDDCSLPQYASYGCFVTPGSCSSSTFRSNTVPAAVPAFGGACVDTVGCGFACNASEMPELCGNGVDDNDDNGDGIVNGPAVLGVYDLVDCQDPDCNFGGSLSVTDAQLDFVNCLGSTVTSETDLSSLGLSYYCGNAFDTRINDYRDDVGLCCLAGQYARYNNINGVWTCVPTDPCYPEPIYECGFTYSAPTFNSWKNDDGCLNATTPLACCSVIQFGELDYYSDTGNVKVY
jgi:hypothetical protein